MPTDDSALMRALDAMDRQDSEEERKKAPLYYQHGVAPKYLLERGFKIQTLKAWDIGWDPALQAIVLPATEDGVTVGLIRRFLSGTKYKNRYKNSDGFLPGERGHLFGLDHVPHDSTWAVICEGPLDAIWLWQCGFPAVAQLGSSLSDKQADTFKRRFYRCVIGTDSDAAGRKAEQTIRTKLADLSLVRLPIERGKKDVQESTCDYLTHAISLLPGFDFRRF